MVDRSGYRMGDGASDLRSDRVYTLSSVQRSFTNHGYRQKGTECSVASFAVQRDVFCENA